MRISWTDPAFSNGWLVLDRNGNGKIDNGTELFGDLTPQPTSAKPNGFAALAVFDNPSDGGNGNGFIDAGDAVYKKLRVWIDSNHNGVSEPDELHTLHELGIDRIGLTYEEVGRVDSNGNAFRYMGKLWDLGEREHDTTYDVFLILQRLPPNTGGK